MKRITLAVAGAAALAVFAASPAYAWDCLRMSGSQKGLEQSTKSGNWLYASIEDFVAGGVASGAFDEAAGECALDAWRDAKLPEYFALGIGVAGAHGAEQSGRMTEEDFYVLAKNAPTKVLSDGKGVDTLEALTMKYAAECFGPGGAEH